jgi:5-methylcytosine-specific restriction endonuclease McrA
MTKQMSVPAEIQAMMKEHKPTISKKLRQSVFDKSHGFCWYCGDYLSDKWHVDHIEPIRRSADGGVHSLELHNIDNLAPACVPCNLFKSVYSVEGFRAKISKQPDRARKSSVNFRTAERFGLIKETPTDIIFWFERNFPNGQ